MESNVRDIQLRKLTERAKELRCLYMVLEALKNEEGELITIFNRILEVIPPGYQHPTVCEPRIILEGKKYASVDFVESEWVQRAEIVIDNHVSGEIQVAYIQDVFENKPPFLPEEQKLLNAIAEHISQFLFHRRLKKTMEIAPSQDAHFEPGGDSSLLVYESDGHWKWRMQVAEKLVAKMDMERFGVESVYIIGSTKTGQAGPGSDIDLLIHFSGKQSQEIELKAWLEGWGLGLSELNYIKTGYFFQGSLIDAHLISDEDLRKKTSFAAMIGSLENSARLLRSRT